MSYTQLLMTMKQKVLLLNGKHATSLQLEDVQRKNSLLEG